LFLTAGLLARELQVERERGTLTRLRVMPLGSRTIIFGKLATILVVGLVEFTAVLATMSLIFGARWGNPIALAVVSLTLALAVCAIALLIASLAGSPQAAYNFGLFVALGFAALGGNLVPLENLPTVARRVADFTPNGIAIRAMRNIAANGAGVGDVARPSLVILALAVVVAAAAYGVVRRVVES
jgi:ABC-2 type transport system permease protein